MTDPLTPLRGGWGALLLARPQVPLRLLGGDASGGVCAVTRLLGARHLVEAVILVREEGPHTGSGPAAGPPRWALVIDSLHGASMLALARHSRRLRRDALASGILALALVGMSEAERRRAPQRPHSLMRP